MKKHRRCQIKLYPSLSNFDPIMKKQLHTCCLQGPNRVIVASPDTDVFVLLVHHFSDMVYVKFSLIQEGKVYPCTKKWCRITFVDRLWL